MPSAKQVKPEEKGNLVETSCRPDCKHHSLDVSNSPMNANVMLIG